MNFNDTDSVLDFAISQEEQAYILYNKLAETADTAQLKQIFIEFAGEEVRHKEKLETIRQGGEASFSRAETVTDMKISDYTVEDPVNLASISYQDALIFAMKKEKAAFKLYTALAGKVESPDLQQLFRGLAQEEAKHKLQFEIQYDDHVLREN